MIRCKSCKKPIDISKEDYVSLTKIKYVKARATKESDTKFYHHNCKTIVKGQKDL